MIFQAVPFHCGQSIFEFCTIGVKCAGKACNDGKVDNAAVAQSEFTEASNQYAYCPNSNGVLE